MSKSKFAIFILTHGRPDRVYTLRSLERAGYTGKVYLLIDNEDTTAPEYIKQYRDKVIIFDKKKVAEATDSGNNFGTLKSVLYARNACFEAARKLHLKYFMELDDDYLIFGYDMNGQYSSIYRQWIKGFDHILQSLLTFYQSVDQIKSLAMAQSGDFIGGLENQIDKSMNQRRKCMNTFILSVDRPFQFIGEMNDDVNTYVVLGNRGMLFITFPLISIQQKQTQENKDGLTEMYLEYGTYVKSFHTVMYQPSSVKVGLMGERFRRLHHSINWDCTVPCIIPERFRKV